MQWDIVAYTFYANVFESNGLNAIVDSFADLERVLSFDLGKLDNYQAVSIVVYPYELYIFLLHERGIRHKLSWT
jgi:hypothetical protein